MNKKRDKNVDYDEDEEFEEDEQYYHNNYNQNNYADQEYYNDQYYDRGKVDDQGNYENEGYYDDKGNFVYYENQGYNEKDYDKDGNYLGYDEAGEGYTFGTGEQQPAQPTSDKKKKKKGMKGKKDQPAETKVDPTRKDSLAKQDTLKDSKKKDEVLKVDTDLKNSEKDNKSDSNSLKKLEKKPSFGEKTPHHSAKGNSLTRKISRDEGQMIEQPRKTSEKFKAVYDAVTEGGNKPYPAIDYKVTEKQQKEATQTINVVLSGHVDSGKSTLLGSIMSNVKEVSDKDLRKIEKDARAGGKLSKTVNKFAMIADSLGYEREKGITVDVNEKRITYKNKQVVFQDTPGHKDFVPKMISGASQAEFAILMLDGIKTNFLAGIDNRGQTKEHTQLLNSLGVRKLLCCVNKMDENNWNEEDYHFVVERFTNFINSQNFKNIESFQFIPIAALHGHNITKSPHTAAPNSFWWKGYSLVQMFDDLESKSLENISKPFRLNISTYYYSTGYNKKGYLIGGRIEGGVIKIKDKLVVKPSGAVVTVKEIQVDDCKKDMALVGELCDIMVQFDNPNQADDIKLGNVLSSIQFAVPLATKLRCHIITYTMAMPIVNGKSGIFYIGSNKSEGNVTKLIKRLDPDTGEVIKQKPRCLNSDMAAIVEITLEKPICVETFKNFAALGRVQMRDRGETLAVGTIKEIIY